MGATGVASSEPPQPDNAMTPLANNSAVAARPIRRFTLDVPRCGTCGFLSCRFTVQEFFAIGVYGNFRSRPHDGLSRRCFNRTPSTLGESKRIC